MQPEIEDNLIQSLGPSVAEIEELFDGVRTAAAASQQAAAPPLLVVGVWIKTFIPTFIEGQTRPVPNRPDLTMVDLSYIPGCYLTDNRGFSPRYDASARITASAVIGIPQMSLNYICWCDYTVRFECDDGSIVCREQADASRIHFLNLRGIPGRYVEVDVVAAAYDPCTIGAGLIGDVDFRGTIYIDSPTRQILFQGFVEPWPAFEMYAISEASPSREIGSPMFTRAPSRGAGPLDLPGPANVFQEGFTIL